jgi:hypothetical protein
LSAKLRRIALAAIAGVFCLLLVIRAATSPVLFRWKDPGAVDPADGLFVVLSPLRDREPERVASRFLASLRSGECRKDVVNSCESEARYPLTVWKFVDRRDGSPDTSLLYKMYRKNYRPGAWGDAWVTLVSEGGSWRVSHYDTWYYQFIAKGVPPGRVNRASPTRPGRCEPGSGYFAKCRR